MVIKRKMVLMALHSHLIKTANFNWANCVLRYLHGVDVQEWEIWVINCALRLANLPEFQIPKEERHTVIYPHML